MSTVKDPREKKRLSLKLDNRNAYGENDKASRKNIPRGKQRQHQNERRSAAQVLRPAKQNISEDDRVFAELSAKVKAVVSKHKGFKKQPDEPLEVIIANKKTGRPKWARTSRPFKRR